MTKKRQPLKQLDGLRGVASIIVVSAHFYGMFYCGLPDEGTEPPNMWLTALVFNGSMAPPIFFVIGGRVIVESVYYVSDAQVPRLIVAAAIRRPIRLFIPLLAVNTFIYGLTKVGTTAWLVERYDKEFMRTGMLPRSIMARGGFDGNRFIGLSYSELVSVTVRTLLNLDRTLLGVDWTLSIQLVGSFAVFFAALFVRHTNAFGFWAILFFSLFNVQARLPSEYSCISGLLIGFLLCHARNTDRPLLPRQLSSRRLDLRVEKLLRFLTGFYGLFIWFGFNTNFLAPKNEPFYSFITDTMWPGWNDRFIQITGAAAIVYTVETWKPIEHLLNLSLPQYLGRVSFGIYFCHPTVCAYTGTLVIPGLIGDADEVDLLRYSWATYGVAFPIALLCTITAAHLFNACDRVAIKLSRQMAHFMLADDTGRL